MSLFYLNFPLDQSCNLFTLQSKNSKFGIKTRIIQNACISINFSLLSKNIFLYLKFASTIFSSNIIIHIRLLVNSYIVYQSKISLLTLFGEINFEGCICMLDAVEWSQLLPITHWSHVSKHFVDIVSNLITFGPEGKWVMRI